MRPEDVRQRVDRARVRELAFGGFVSFRIEQDRAEFQRRIVSDAILPVVREPPDAASCRSRSTICQRSLISCGLVL